MTKRVAYKPPVGLRPALLWGQECSGEVASLQAQHTAEQKALNERQCTELTEQRLSQRADRRREVSAAIQRYVETNHAVPSAWFEELRDLQVGLP